ncbi:methyl-accepting chemotaxis protein [Paenibacillus aestuarii]|uniref:Methyl-accepting chemotaxis protein n=1 Tax=Paenibacillus aestuarii TaxID=516965 RepID=A0ABW0KFK9_9BACL|nr:methyl-accepting chemotaxis protein [Paenibacillus aestuarii]
MMRFTVRKKMIAVFTIIFVLIGSLSLTDLERMSVLKENNKSLVKNWLKGIQITEEIHFNTEHLLSNYFGKQLETDANKQAAMDNDLAATIAGTDKLVENYKEAVSNADDEKNYNALKQDWQQFKDVFAKSKELAKDPSKVKEAQDNFAQVSTTFTKLQQDVALMVKFNQAGADAAELESSALYQKSVLISVTVLSVILLFMLAVSFVMVRIISKPVRVASEALTRIADGDLTVQPLQVKNKDEIGTLVQAVNLMAVNLRQSVGQMLEASNSVAASSQQLFASSEHNASAAHHVAQSVQELAIGADMQAQSSLEVGRAVEEMSIGVQRIAETTSEVSELSISANELAKQGTTAMQRAMAKMQTVSLSVDAAHKVIQELEKHSQNIGQISTLIGSIASQTNLLALNAAIEAARAGDSGKGFAVVAGEVRKLASQTDDSVRSISELIVNIQRDSVRASEVMQSGITEVHEGLTEIGAAEQAFVQIASASEEVAGKIQETAATAEQMAASSQEVAATVANVGSVAQQTSGTAQIVAAATEEQLASNEEITTSAKGLATIAQDLQQVVGAFRI